MTVFNPSLQGQYCRDLRRVYTGSAPPLGVVSRAYGVECAESWVEIQLEDLADFAGQRGKLSIGQLAETAAMIRESYGHLKVTELMLFFQKFKRGEYGKFYGSVDPIAIMAGLKDFAIERGRILRQYESEAESHRRPPLIDSAAALSAYKAAQGLKPDDSVTAVLTKEKSEPPQPNTPQT